MQPKDWFSLDWNDEYCVRTLFRKFSIVPMRMVVNFVHKKIPCFAQSTKKDSSECDKKWQCTWYSFPSAEETGQWTIKDKRTDSYKPSYILYKRNINVLLILVPKSMNKMSSEIVESFNDTLPEPYIRWGYLEGRGRGAI